MDDLAITVATPRPVAAEVLAAAPAADTPSVAAPPMVALPQQPVNAPPDLEVESGAPAVLSLPTASQTTSSGQRSSQQSGQQDGSQPAQLRSVGLLGSEEAGQRCEAAQLYRWSRSFVSHRTEAAYQQGAFRELAVLAFFTAIFIVLLRAQYVVAHFVLAQPVAVVLLTLLQTANAIICAAALGICMSSLYRRDAPAMPAWPCGKMWGGFRHWMIASGAWSVLLVFTISACAAGCRPAQRLRHVCREWPQLMCITLAVPSCSMRGACDAGIGLDSLWH